MDSLKPWITFAGGVLVIVVLYWAQAVLVPIALAILLSFVLAPPVTWLERFLGRVPAVLLVVTLVFLVLGLAGWGLARQMNNLATDLPAYRTNILAKIADVRGVGKGGTVEKLQKTIEEIKTDIGKVDAPKGRTPQQVMVAAAAPAGFPGFAWLGPILGPLGTAGLVVALVIFMLLERRDLRDRLIGAIGQGRLTVTTKAFDEAGTRVSRQLLMQSLVNAIYGMVAGLGLYFLGVPYALVWGRLARASLRSISRPVLAGAGSRQPRRAGLEAQWMVPACSPRSSSCQPVLETVLYASSAACRKWRC
jgi:predicted PurR-regulated permease PerM